MITESFSKPSTRAADDEMNEEVCNAADKNFSERLHTTSSYKAFALPLKKLKEGKCIIAVVVGCQPLPKLLRFGS